MKVIITILKNIVLIMHELMIGYITTDVIIVFIVIVYFNSSVIALIKILKKINLIILTIMEN